MAAFNQFEANQKQTIRSFLDQTAPERERWIQTNSYYYQDLYRIIAKVIPPGSLVCHIGCDTPGLLNFLAPSEGLGICLTEMQKESLQQVAANQACLKFQTIDSMESKNQKFDFIVVTSLGYFFDIQDLIQKVRYICHPHSRVLFINYNFLWEPLFFLAEKIKLRMPQPIQRQNMVPTHHVVNLIQLAQFQLVKWSSHLLFPLFIPFFSPICNRFLVSIFPFQYLASTEIIVIRPIQKMDGPIPLSVVVPCKNEKGNIEAIVTRTLAMNPAPEIILVDDQSTDGTLEEMRRCITMYGNEKIRVVQGPGQCKAEAVRAGIHAATGELIAILDADLAVAPEELPRCLQPLLDGTADFVNTIRFVYPQENKAMRWLNIFGNRLFALIFTYLLRQRIGDTLSGTKVFWKKDYLKIDALKNDWIWRDQWGDFEQLLGASRLGLKIVDIPVHYAERTYGETKMKNRLKNGLHMLKLCLGGLIRLRFG